MKQIRVQKQRTRQHDENEDLLTLEDIQQMLRTAVLRQEEERNRNGNGGDSHRR